MEARDTIGGHGYPGDATACNPGAAYAGPGDGNTERHDGRSPGLALAAWRGKTGRVCDPGGHERAADTRMRPGMQCLLEALRGQAGLRPVDADEWRQALELAEGEHVLPLMVSRLQQSGVVLPDSTRELVEQAARDAAIAAFLWSSELKSLLRTFYAAEIPVIPLKGPSLAERFYGSATTRVCRDLDLLVQLDDIPRAEVVLARLGFLAGDRHDDYDHKWMRGTIKVELHFDVANPLEFNFDVAGAWERARRGSFAGEPAWMLAAEDEIFYLCLHGVRHRFDRLSLTVDISLAARSLADAIGNTLHLRPQLVGLAPLIVLGCALATHLDPRHPPPFRIAVPVKHRLTMEDLASKLWDISLSTASLSLGWWSMHSFYLSTEVRPFHRLLRRVQHLRVVATRLIGPDFVFASRFGLHRRWQVWLLRPMRLLLRRKRRFINE